LAGSGNLRQQLAGWRQHEVTGKAAQLTCSFLRNRLQHMFKCSA
jgi:hypothetical protein